MVKDSIDSNIAKQTENPFSLSKIIFLCSNSIHFVALYCCLRLQNHLNNKKKNKCNFDILSIYFQSPMTPVILTSQPTFSIGGDSGEISLIGSLDFEQTKQYRLLVVATDQGAQTSLSANMTLTVKVKDVNDNSPEFTRPLYEMRVPENVGLGFKVGTVLATDADSDNNKRVSYSLKAADDSAVGTSVRYDGSTFGIGSVDGVIWTRDTLNRELRDSYELLVEAADHGSPEPRTATARVRILVEDVNDNWPKFSRSEYRFSIRENLEHDTFVGRVMAT